MNENVRMYVNIYINIKMICFICLASTEMLLKNNQSLQE